MIKYAIANLLILFLLFPNIIHGFKIHNKAKLIYDYFQKTEYKNVAMIIASQAILETGHFKSSKHNELNNYFSIKDWKDNRCKMKPIYCMKRYKNIKESIIDMHNYISRKKYRTSPLTYYNDLVKNGYAQDPLYVQKIKSVVKSFKNNYK